MLRYQVNRFDAQRPFLRRAAHCATRACPSGVGG